MKFLPLIIFLFSINCCIAQNTIGLPEITNYSDQEYHGGTQTWSLKQGKNGILYFANNDGLLSFDGNYWKQYTLPNRTIVRSLSIDSLTGYIYIGSQNEIGYFSPGINGELSYTSLKHLIPEKLREFADIWHVEILGNAIFFRANQKIFEYKDQVMRVFKAPSEWRYMKKVGNRMFAQDRKQGIMQFNGKAWLPFCNHPVLKDGLVTGILNFRGDTLMVTTLKNGIFLLYNAKLTRKITVADPIFTSNRIYCAIAVNKEEFAIGTTSGGCYIINIEGKLVQTITRSEGLQNNNVLCLLLDNSQNLWIGLDNGIDLVAYNSAIKRILPDKNNQLAAYAIRIIKDQLYVGTSDGLYSVPLYLSNSDLSFSKGNFLRIPNTNGQVWSVEEINNHIIMGHHDGTFLIHNNLVTAVLPGLGSWLYVPLNSFFGDNETIAGTYNGLQLLRSQGDNFVDAGKIAGLNESLRFLTIDNEVLWASHPYKGIYKIQLSENKKTLTYKLYTQKEGLPGNLNNIIFNVKGKVVAATSKGIYEYDASFDRFIPSSLFPQFKDKSVSYLNEDPDGNIWFESDKKVGVIDYQKFTPSSPFSILYFPELADKLVKGFEYIYTYNRNNIFLGSEKGVYHLNYGNYLQHLPTLNMLISSVRVTGEIDSLIFGGYANKETNGIAGEQKIIQLPNSCRSIHFEYSCPLYSQQKNIEYSYQLEGFDNNWSGWTKKIEKDYTNLHYGTYTFKVKARTNLGNESNPVSYTFRIRPAWYQTGLANLSYLLALFLLVYVYIKWQKKKFADQQLKYIREQEHLKYMYQLEMDRNEKEIVKLQNEKLESDVNFKNRELANATMHLVERGKVLSKIREELIRFQKNTPFIGPSGDFKRIINQLSDAEKDDTYWDQFVGHFDQVYGNYLTLLKTKFQNLSPTDLKLSAYLRINLSSKEISQLMNISVRGVEIARYRLRKKLQLSTDENLYDFLINI